MLHFNNSDPLTPQTHVFIIGVGVYPFLAGGSSPKQQNGSLSQLGQLTSTIVSAKKFLETVMQFHQQNSWIKPLGSVEVLISKESDSPDTYESPTRQNVDTAYNNWKDRCNTNEENVAVFYFAGHGFEKEQHHLLLEDFGNNVNNPWLGSFEFNDTRQAFYSNKTTTQCFFVDACRKVDASLINYKVTSTPLEIPNWYSTECKYNLTIKAAAHNELSYGEKNNVSYFTKALIHALNGYASFRNSQGDWVIDMGSVAENINVILAMISEEQDFPQRFHKLTNDTTEILKLAGPPKVQLKVICDPNEAHQVAELHCNTWNGIPVNKRSPGIDPWKFEIEPGFYTLEAKFSQPTYKHLPQPSQVSPPFTEENLKCQKV